VQAVLPLCAENLPACDVNSVGVRPCQRNSKTAVTWHGVQKGDAGCELNVPALHSWQNCPLTDCSPAMQLRRRTPSSTASGNKD
jgi:hypothetical protein